MFSQYLLRTLNFFLHGLLLFFSFVWLISRIHIFQLFHLLTEFPVKMVLCSIRHPQGSGFHVGLSDSADPQMLAKMTACRGRQALKVLFSLKGYQSPLLSGGLCVGVVGGGKLMAFSDQEVWEWFSSPLQPLP